MRKIAVATALAALTVSTLEGQSRRRDRERPEASAGGNAASVAQLAGFEAPAPDGALSCLCNELTRVVTGLRALTRAADQAAFASAFSSEHRTLQQQRTAVDAALETAERELRNARGKGYLEQEKLCGSANDRIGSHWRDWQPFLGANGVDGDYFDGKKVGNPDVPDHGDEAADQRGRHCRPGQWWEEDRALWAINGREGICRQQHYRIEQVLKGEKGDVGHRCYEYKLK
jgi:hypothetical protein